MVQEYAWLALYRMHLQEFVFVFGPWYAVCGFCLDWSLQLFRAPKPSTRLGTRLRHPSMCPTKHLLTRPAVRPAHVFRDPVAAGTSTKEIYIYIHSL